MKQQGDVQPGAEHRRPEVQAWEAPTLREFDVGELTKFASCAGDDGMGVFTHS